MYAKGKYFFMFLSFAYECVIIQFIFAVIFLKPPPEPEPPSKIALKKMKTLKARSRGGENELGLGEQGELMSIITEYMRSRFAEGQKLSCGRYPSRKIPPGRT